MSLNTDDKMHNTQCQMAIAHHRSWHKWQ